MLQTFPSRPALQVGACALLLASLIAPLPQAAAAQAMKDSPYASPRDETGGPKAEQPKPEVLRKMEGTTAPGSEKESPYAAPKDELALSYGPAIGRLWWLLAPIGLATGSYLYLRSREESA